MIRLLYNYYEDRNPVRKKEIDFCLQKNLENPHLNVIIVESLEKPAYNTMFEKLNWITGPDDLNIICNSDIFFDDSILLAEQHLHNRDVFALTRWDFINEHNIKFFDRRDSQDTWMWKGKMEHVISGFTLGKRGCDNRIAHEFRNAGYRITNPSRTIKTYHVHNSNVRNYTQNDVVHGPYLHVEITGL
jgi:hypothetical protein